MGSDNRHFVTLHRLEEWVSDAVYRSVLGGDPVSGIEDTWGLL